jgi:hypothetical protein
VDLPSDTRTLTGTDGTCRGENGAAVLHSYEDRGVGEDEAEERAARTVNKERRQHGETKAQRRGRSS